MRCLNELALFAGAGGGLLASELLGWNTICGVELAEYPREVLLQRQRDGMLNRFPVWDDVSTFDGRPWRGKVDVISGGFPCQDISAAGKGAGITGERSGLWKEYFRIIGEVRPEFVFAENSPLLRTRGLGTVVQDLDGLGYHVRWGVLGAWHVGANHKRNRMWIVAHADRDRVREQCGRAESWTEETFTVEHGETQSVADANLPRPQGRHSGVLPERTSELFVGEGGPSAPAQYSRPWQSEPDVGRVADGVAKRVDRIKAIGNGQVPAVAATAFRILAQEWI